MNEELTKQPSFTAEFKVPRLGNNKPVLNEAGEQVYDKYIYNFELMGMNRITAGHQFFELHQKMFEKLPQTPEHVALLADRSLIVRAYSAILIKIKDDGSHEDYDPAIVELSIHAMNNIGRGKAEWEKLQRCKLDFFGNTGLQSVELITQSNLVMMQFANIMKEIAPVMQAAGIENLDGLKGLMGLVFDKAAASGNTPRKRK